MISSPTLRKGGGLEGYGSWGVGGLRRVEGR